MRCESLGGRGESQAREAQNGSQRRRLFFSPRVANDSQSSLLGGCAPRFKGIAVAFLQGLFVEKLKGNEIEKRRRVSPLTSHIRETWMFATVRVRTSGGVKESGFCLCARAGSVAWPLSKGVAASKWFCVVIAEHTARGASTTDSSDVPSKSSFGAKTIGSRRGCDQRSTLRNNNSKHAKQRKKQQQWSDCPDGQRELHEGPRELSNRVSSRSYVM